MQRDEWGQAIVHKSARKGFVAMLLALDAGAPWLGLVVPSAASVDALALICALIVPTYFVSDVWLRRS